MKIYHLLLIVGIFISTIKIGLAQYYRSPFRLDLIAQPDYFIKDQPNLQLNIQLSNKIGLVIGVKSLSNKLRTERFFLESKGRATHFGLRFNLFGAANHFLDPRLPRKLNKPKFANCYQKKADWLKGSYVQAGVELSEYSYFGQSANFEDVSLENTIINSGGTIGLGYLLRFHRLTVDLGFVLKFQHVDILGQESNFTQKIQDQLNHMGFRTVSELKLGVGLNLF